MKTKFGFTIPFLLILTGCLTSLFACTKTQSKISNKLIEQNDLPQGWLVFRETSGEEWGGKSFNIGFEYGTELEDPALEHQLIVYSDVVSAINGFNEYSDFIYSEIWVEPEEVNFHTINSNDFVEYKCVKLIINAKPVQNCLVLQQHNNYLSAIEARMGEPYLTFEILNSVLRSIDKKLNEE